MYASIFFSNFQSLAHQKMYNTQILIKQFPSIPQINKKHQKIAQQQINMSYLNINSSSQSYSQVCQRLGLHFQKTIDQVGVKLKYFIDTVSVLYETRGINFPIRHNYTNLMRLLTPFEILSRFQIVQNNQIISQNLINKIIIGQAFPEQIRHSYEINSYISPNPNLNLKLNQKPNKASQISKQISQNSQGSNQVPKKQDYQKEQKQKQAIFQNQLTQYSSIYLKRKLKQREKKIQKCHNLNISQQGYSVRRRNIHIKESIYRSEGTRNFLTEQLENQLYRWAMGQLNLQKSLCVKQIIGQAKYIGRFIKNLSVSPSWVTRFLQKHEDLLILYKKYRCRSKLSLINKQKQQKIFNYTYNNQINSDRSQENEKTSQKMFCNQEIRQKLNQQYNRSLSFESQQLQEDQQQQQVQ